MVVQQRPGETVGTRLFKKPRKAGDERLPIVVVEEYGPPFDPADNYVVEETGNVDACSSWHWRNVAEIGSLVS